MVGCRSSADVEALTEVGTQSPEHALCNRTLGTSIGPDRGSRPLKWGSMGVMLGTDPKQL